ncbi:hypothetical protein pEaSNUABM40_00251 [Erwinia phage pEa_SNUABM_40]|uniref:Uncharacterized protein n=1 Tax=Erwinia phage pEa_SNUABM_3 TaxID=2869552 RepID=A0AAE7XJ33_9CAUD|nr:hypothetical protein MPK68_gp248 [Erwinia phage pEa_SNUABM_3]QZE56445.1 hypothetical protein pEaSNUABM3_00248 [Erwinia phage pEa_SNUABM_3]QZE56783.1 hypothetical protein pEaSNUABM20_00247 [Erwinia phage pEa_SNUABM_20]QZE58467.1 hypothetical protein pEaSNUABM40_00251 [Erwinia phage pEa_SNUABM_40]
MSRVQTLWIPDMESYEPYVRSLCHMARALENNGLNYGKLKRVVVIGLSKRSVESYVKQLLNSNTLPNTLVCFGIDEAPDSHKEFSFIGSHVVLMHDLTYAGDNAMHRVSQRVLEIILSLKPKPQDTELKNGALSLVYQNPMLWSFIRDTGSSMYGHSRHIQYAEGIASTVGVDQLMSCENNEDFHKLHAQTITIGQEFFYVKTSELLSRLGSLSWSLGCINSEFRADYKIVLHEDLRIPIFEEFLLGDFGGF